MDTQGLTINMAATSAPILLKQPYVLRKKTVSRLSLCIIAYQILACASLMYFYQVTNKNVQASFDASYQLFKLKDDQLERALKAINQQQQSPPPNTAINNRLSESIANLEAANKSTKWHFIVLLAIHVLFGLIVLIALDRLEKRLPD